MKRWVVQVYFGGQWHQYGQYPFKLFASFAASNIHVMPSRIERCER